MKKRQQIFFIIGLFLIFSCSCKKDSLPVLSTTAVTNITSSSASCGGNITSDGGASVTARGVCWSIAQNPTISNYKTTDGNGIGSFISAINGLNPGVVYNVRAYATNSVGTTYGNQVTLPTPVVLPVLLTEIPLRGGTHQMSCRGIIVSTGGVNLIACGMCWSTNQNPTIADNKTTEIPPTGQYFVSSIYPLSYNTTSYIRAYATNSLGTSYGNQQSVFCDW